MTTLPKPKHCGQNWLEMKPTDGGRICGQCHKTIVNFSRMTWADIDKIQRANNNSVCGMYSQRQLDNWGHEIPKNNCSKAVATTALLFSLVSATETFSQTTITTDSTKKTIIRGTITGKSQQGNIDTLGYTTVMLKDTKIGVIADEQGQYKFDITDYIDTISNPAIVFSMLGYSKLELKLNNTTKGEIKYDAQLNQVGVNITYFYVTEPKTLGQRIKWKFKKWFGRKKK